MRNWAKICLYGVMVVMGICSVSAKLYFAYALAKKHMPSLTFWEYYWSFAK